MVKIFAILKPIVWLLMKYYYGLSPQMIETEPGTVIKMWVPSNPKNKHKVVFLHGFAADGIFSWMSQVMALSATYAVYVPDLLFFGGSFTDSPRRSTAFQAEVVAAALRKVGVQKCAVVGLSYGASIGFKMAEFDPELVELVVASGTVIEFTESLARVLLKKYGFGSVTELLMPTTVEGVINFLTVANHAPPSIPTFVAKDFLREFYSNRKERSELAKAWVIPDNEVKPISINQKVHLVWGDDDKVFNSEIAESTKRELGGDTTLVYIKDGGHAVQGKKPDLYNAQLNNILASFYTNTKQD